ncbi:nitrate/nitrite transporter [Sporocytophaga myxococcoides]|uniref:Nitrate/nitrite transporter n=1 Tax=Sporocytophaga myxococcoides TaxID=153721 RepID=A0A098LGT0_9BACT|nr:MFS transporter [Sporocytophaga myxococcoides]GAL86206.1 nitrate/nitrite transporter [Sporocytophaga myxococcoides]
MQISKATKIELLNFKCVPMKAFHASWLTFFICFFAWFGLAPLMPEIKNELNLSKAQIANISIAAVSMTVFARLLIGWLCDKIGPRWCYVILLSVGALPVMMIGFVNSYESFLIGRLFIGLIGASFVITQYHTSVMFAPNIVGTANATAAGWGNLGGGVTQVAMPAIFAGVVSLGFTASEAWRIAMIFPGLALLLMAYVYYKYTQDTTEGNVLELRKKNPEFKAKNPDIKGSFWMAFKEYRVWILGLVYGACFGIELTMDGIAAIYFTEEFNTPLMIAGIIAASFGMMNLFARALGGIYSDKISQKFGLKGRVILLSAFLFLEGIGIILFSEMNLLPLAILTLILFALFVKMSNGVTYSIVPFVNKKALGSVAGIVGAGGNIGAVLANSVFTVHSYRYGLFIIGTVVCGISVLALFLKFPNEVSSDLLVNIGEAKENEKVRELTRI